MKTRQLSGLEQKVYFQIQNMNSGVTLEEIKDLQLIKNVDLLRHVISSLIKKGWLIKLKRETYIVKQPAKKPLIADPYYLSQLLFNGYIGLASALKIHNMLTEEPFTIYIITKSKVKSIAAGEYEIKAIAFGKRATGYVFKDNLKVSSKAKTIYDCLHYFKYDFYSTVLRAINMADFSENDWKELISYVKIFESSQFCQRLGYLLSILPKTKIPKFVFESLKSKVKKDIALNPAEKGKGKYSKEWKVIDNMGRKKLLSWWLYG